MTPNDPLTNHLEWMRQRNLRPSSIRHRRVTLTRIEREIGTPLLASTQADLERWRRTRSVAPVTVANEIQQLAGFYRWALDTELIEKDPSRRLIRPKLPRRLPRPMSENNLAMAIQLAPPRIRPHLVLAAYAGLRAIEIANLQRHEILDTAEPPVLLVTGKGDKQRIVPLSPYVIDELRAGGLPRSGFVFRRRDGRGGANTPHRISAMANIYLHAMGINDTLHSMRHRFGTVTFQQCQDIRVVQELLGHSTPAPTAGYVAYSRTIAVDVVNSIAPTCGRTNLPGHVGFTTHRYDTK